MRRRRPHIPQRRRIFLGCEGQSEGGYGTLVARIAREYPGIHVFIDVRVLNPGAGNPRALVQRAVQIIEEEEEPYALKAILLDVATQAQINAAAAALAAQHGIRLVWQRHDHEALLLRHLPNCQDRQPPRGASLGALQAEWQGYVKGMSAQQLAARISLDHIRQACMVEAELRVFLTDVGVIAAA